MTVATLLALGRVSNLPTVWTNVVAATVLAGASATPTAIFAAAAALSLFYCGGMFLNDAFDREIDAVERPSRPIPSGRASSQAVFVLGSAQLIGGAVLLAATARAGGAAIGRVIALAVLLAGVIVAYDAFHRRSPAAPWLMGACRALVYLCAAAALATEPRWPELLWAAVALMLYTAGVTYVAAVEASGHASRAWPLALVAAAPLAMIGASGLATAALPVTLVTGWSTYALRRAFRKDAPDVPGGIVRAIAGMCLLDAAWAWLYGAHAAAVLCALGFPLTRLAQRRVAGT